jgi:hypothetical protein
VAEDRPYIQYPFRSPRMDQSVPPNEVNPGSLGRLSGVDGRFNGALRKYYGNRLVVDIDGVSGLGAIDSYNGPDFIRQVTFQKRNTSTVYRGFVIRWDSQDSTSNEQVDLVYTIDNGSNWSVLSIWAAGNGITSSLEIDCSVSGGYLMVAIDTKATKTIYWNGSALVAVSSGPGAFSATLAATTLNTTAVDTGYQLNGNGTYQVAWRFYDSTRGIYSALSDPLTVRLDHYKTTKAIGTISFSSAGGDSGLLLDGDTITINGRVYEADDDSSYSGDVQVDISDLSTIAEHAEALADAINGDSSSVVTASAEASTVLLESKIRGSTGNAYTLTKSETGANTNDIAVSGATLTGGGVVTSEPEQQCRATVSLPNQGEIIGTGASYSLEESYNTDDDGYSTFWTTMWRGQTFTTLSSYSIKKVKLKLYRVGSPGTVTVSIKETDVDGKPTGEDLASGTFDGSSLTDDTDGEWQEVIFDSAYSLESATKYAIVIRLNGNGTNCLAWRKDTSSPTYDDGQYVYSNDSGSSWTLHAHDAMFEIYSYSYEYDYDDFDALFDTVDIFRTIDLGGTSATAGAIFYLEQTIAKTGNWEDSSAWDSLQASIGTIVDEALPFQTMYDPEKDIVTSPPQSGTIARYEGLTFMAQAASVNGGFDTLFSSSEHTSPEYFSTYNKRIGDPDDGRPLRFLAAGDSLFQLCYNAIIHIFKSGKIRPIQMTRLHRRRGTIGKEAAHSSGNSIFMISGLGMALLNGTDGSMGQISAVDRVLFDDWKSSLSGVKSCYDARMNASFFLNPTREEMIILWHTTQTCSMLDGANFVGATSGPDIGEGKNDRAFFITKTGLIVSPDVVQAGSGTMWDISSSYTLNGTVTTGGSTLTDSSATFHADMIGCKLYFSTGDNAGEGQTISSVDVGNKTISFETSFTNTIAVGDTYAVSPVPFSLRAWPVQTEEISRFNRWIITGVSAKARKLSGFDDNVNNKLRVGAYRNSTTEIEATTAFPTMATNPADSAAALNIDGVDIEPYIEQISSGTMFELTDAEFSLMLSDSRSNSDS